MAQALPLIIGGLVGQQVVKSVFGGKKETPAVAETPKVMPLADDAAVAAAKKRSLQMQMQRGGRSSTILSDNSNDSLGN